MKLTEHAKIRYVQRVLKIENEDEAKQYIKENESEVFSLMYKMYTNSTLIYKNYPPTLEAGSSQNIYLNDNIIIITTSLDEKIITLYHITLDLDKDENEMKIIKMIKEISSGEYELNSIKKANKSHGEYLKNLNFTINYLENQLLSLNEEYEKGLAKGLEMGQQLTKRKNERWKLMNELLYGFKKFDPKDRDY